MKIGNYKIHPICAEVPEPNEEDYANLRESIRQRGIRKNILMYGSEVISGKTRVRIAVELGIEPPIQKWNPKAKEKTGIDREIRELILDEDFNRRHLKTGQRAIFAAALVTTEQGRQESNTKNLVFSQGQAAELAGVSDVSIQQAQGVLKNGSAPLVDAVRAGEVSVSDAAKIVDLPKAEQTAAVKAVEKGEAKTVSAAAGKSRPPKHREPGEDPVEPQHKPRPKEGNAKLDFDDDVIDKHFGNLIRAVDDRAEALKCKQSRGHKDCIADLNAFMQSWRAWRKATRA